MENNLHITDKLYLADIEGESKKYLIEELWEKDNSRVFAIITKGGAIAKQKGHANDGEFTIERMIPLIRTDYKYNLPYLMPTRNTKEDKLGVVELENYINNREQYKQRQNNEKTPR